MRNEKGYLCCVLSTDNFENSRDHESWFGPKKTPTSSAWQSSEAFITNGLKTFPTLRDTRKAQEELSHKPFVKKISLMHIEMDIAETQKDLDSLKRKRNLVSIMTTPYEQYVFGKDTEKSAHNGYIPGGYIYTNGRKPFDNYFDAEHSAQEIKRQGQSRATIATFKARKVK